MGYINNMTGTINNCFAHGILNILINNQLGRNNEK